MIYLNRGFASTRYSVFLFHSQELKQKFDTCMLGSLFFILCHWHGIDTWSSSSSGSCNKFFKAWAMPQYKLRASRMHCFHSTQFKWNVHCFLNDGERAQTSSPNKTCSAFLMVAQATTFCSLCFLLGSPVVSKNKINRKQFNQCFTLWLSVKQILQWQAFFHISVGCCISWLDIKSHFKSWPNQTKCKPANHEWLSMRSCAFISTLVVSTSWLLTPNVCVFSGLWLRMGYCNAWDTNI